MSTHALAIAATTASGSRYVREIPAISAIQSSCVFNGTDKKKGARMASKFGVECLPEGTPLRKSPIHLASSLGWREDTTNLAVYQ